LREANRPKRRDNTRRWYAANKEHRAAYLRSWKKANRARCNALSRKRDALKLGNGPRSNEPRLRVREMQPHQSQPSARRVGPVAVL